jgi:diaminopimelate epimerase
MNVMVPFTKLVAAGNDFVVVDTVRHRAVGRLRAHWSRVSRQVCARHTGVGADGLLVLEPSRRADVRMRVFNPDGSEAEMCGNGARCVAVYQRSAVSRQPSAQTSRVVRIETQAGVMDAAVRGSRVSMRMPDPAILGLKIPVRLNGAVYPVDLVNTGVPHAVLVVNDLERTDVDHLGRAIRHHRAFGPQGANVDFVQVRGPSAIAIRTYERGVEGETLGCGTGVAACAVAHAMGRA